MRTPGGTAQIGMGVWVEYARKYIPSKDPLGTGEPLKETENMLEDENDKQVLTSTEGSLKKK